MSGMRLLLLLLPGGCDRLQAAEDLVSPVVAQGLYLGLDLPDGVDFEGTDILEYSAACTLFLAYLSDPSDLASSPVEGAGVAFESDDNGRLELDEAGDGKYLVTAAEGLNYEPGDGAQVNVIVQGEAAHLSVNPPEAPTLDLPTTHSVGASLDIDISGQGYDGVIAAAYNVTRNNLTWTNLPEEVDEIYAFTHPEEPQEAIRIPAEAFPGKGSFVVGVAGMELADPSRFDGVNTSISAFMAGEFALFFMVVEEE